MPIVHQICGIILLLGGLVFLPLPIPLGVPMITIGLALLAPYVPFVQRGLRKVRTKWPAANEALMKYHPRMPAIIQRAIDKTHPENCARTHSDDKARCE